MGWTKYKSKQDEEISTLQLFPLMCIRKNSSNRRKIFRQSFEKENSLIVRPTVELTSRDNVYAREREREHTRLQRSGQPGPDTQKHHQLYRSRRPNQQQRHRQSTLSHSPFSPLVFTPIPITHGGGSRREERRREGGRVGCRGGTVF